MSSINIGILAHIDAGKTSLTERLLFDCGAIGSLGSVDAGTTQTDSNEIERRRGITVRTAVASFTTGDLRVNLVDTPGHSEFIAEVERALSVLDGAVLVLSAVEGVQAQTRVIMKTLRAMRLPTLIFVNKIDRAGARADELVDDIRHRLTSRVVPMNTVRGPGTATARTTGTFASTMDSVAELLADNDDTLLAKLVADEPVTPSELQRGLAAQTAAGVVCPLFFGSARSGAGVPDLVAGIRELLPAASGRADAEAHGVVFAIERDRDGEKAAYVRMFDGTVRARERIRCHRRDPDNATTEYVARVNAVEVIGTGVRDEVSAGDIARIKGMATCQVGDRIGTVSGTRAADQARFSRPSLETLVRSRQPAQAPRLHAALMTLAEQDPLIAARAAGNGETSVLLYGEIQKEIIAETLARDFGVEPVFEPSRTIHLERPVGRGSAVVDIGRSPFVAGVGLRVEPGRPGDGIRFGRETEFGALPQAFHRAIEETVHESLAQGLFGWEVADCVVTLVHTAFDNACSTGGDFRLLTPVVLMRALNKAGTRVYEPCHAYEVEVPEDLMSVITSQLLSHEARIRDTTATATSWLIEGDIPARQVHGMTKLLPELTRGEGVWWSTARGDRRIHGAAPRRDRTDGNPLNPREYLYHLARRAR